jgi:hypothetical protein
MLFPYQSALIIGQPAPNLPPGTLLRWRPLVPITIYHPHGHALSQFQQGAGRYRGR